MKVTQFCFFVSQDMNTFRTFKVFKLCNHSAFLTAEVFHFWVGKKVQWCQPLFWDSPTLFQYEIWETSSGSERTLYRPSGPKTLGGPGLGPFQKKKIERIWAGNQLAKNPKMVLHILDSLAYILLLLYEFSSSDRSLHFPIAVVVCTMMLELVVGPPKKFLIFHTEKV